MSLSKSKCWYSNNCLHFLKSAVLLDCESGNNAGIGVNAHSWFEMSVCRKNSWIATKSLKQVWIEQIFERDVFTKKDELNLEERLNLCDLYCKSFTIVNYDPS